MNTTISSKNDKMNWFVDKYNNKQLEYIVANSKQNFGTVVMPTGTGKSGVVYEDIIHTIDNNPKGHKVIINISCPILKLTQQFIRDFFSVANEIYKGKEDTFSFFINSSDNGNNYSDAVKDMNIDIDNFKSIENKFINNPNSDIAIVASCHKSLYKFISRVSKINNRNIDIITYIDEAHLIDLHQNNEDDIVYVDLNKLCEKSTKVYAFTATPDEEVTTCLRSWCVSKENNRYIYNKKAVDAIGENLILPPHVKYIQSATDHITTNMLKSIMKDAKYSNSNIDHKILVTLTSAEQLKKIRLELEKDNYKIFSTCSQFGYSTDDDVDEQYKDVTEFIKDVDDYQGDCFVLHIKQLIQGIDIKSLTDCVIYSANAGSMKHYRHVIQIIDRILRPLSGERGMNKEDRKKKVGRVYFITPIDNISAKQNIANFICRYYGFSNIEFSEKEYREGGMTDNEMFDNFQHDNAISGWDNNMIKELLINLEDYIKTNILNKKQLMKRLHKPIDFKKEAEDILHKYDAFDKEYNSSELLDNRDLLKKIYELFEKYGITD